ncbi:MAG: flavin reductase family protein [Nitrospinales bacterium]
MNDLEKSGKALGRLASGLFILTARFGDREDAILVSWVNQCSFEPLTVSVALAKSRPARLLVEASNSFSLNILGTDSNGLLKRFSKPPAAGTDVFEGLDIRRGALGLAVLNDAVSHLECEVIQQVPVGDHVLYVGKVVDGDLLQGGEPYVHVRNSGLTY